MITAKILARSGAIGLASLMILTGYSPPAPGPSPSHYYHKGQAYELAGRYDRAERQFKRAISVDPTMAEAHLALGAVYLKTGRIDEAEATIITAIVTLPRSRLRGRAYRNTLSMAYNNMGVVEEWRAVSEVLEFELTDAEAHRRNAQSHYHNALELDPRNSLARDNLLQLPGRIKNSDYKGLPAAS